jgi:hypothetical protein
MSYLEIPGTPLQINVRYAENSQPPVRDHALVGQGSLTPLGKLLGGLISQDVVTALQQLVTPLDQIFSNLWTDPSTQSSIQSAVQQAVLNAKPKAYDISISVPSQGSLRADVGNLSPGVAKTLPAGTQGLQLTLSYQVPGFQVSFSERTDSIWGSWADPSYNLAFDGEVEISVGVPSDPRISPGATAQFIARNPTGSASNFFADWIGFWQIIGGFFTGSSPPSPQQPDQFVGIGAYVSGLYQVLAQIGQPLAQAFAFGFRVLAPVATSAPIPGTTPGNTAELDLTHAFDGPPTITLIGSTPSVFSAEIGANPNQAHAGGQLGVTGGYFPSAQSTQLTITWTDTTSGQVVKSEVTWGQASLDAAGNPAPPANPNAPFDITRHGPYDNQNTYTFKNLLPNTTYAFQVRSFDVPGFDLIATQRSAWTFFTTAATDQVQLILDYNDTLLGFATLQPDGTFVTTVIVPASVPAGTYQLRAVLAGQQMAQTPVTVVAANVPLTPSLQILDPDTGIPFSGAAIVVGTLKVRLRGANYSQGQVDLSIDTVAGTNLGSVVADTGGGFAIDVIWPFGTTGPHSIIGEQGAAQAAAQVFGENPAG